MADFFNALGDALSNRISNRGQDVLNVLNNPTDYIQNRVEGATTATNYGAGAGRGFVNPAPVVPEEPAIAPLPSPSVMPQNAVVPNQDQYNAQIAKAESGNNPNIGYHNREKGTAYGPYGTTAAAWEEARKIHPNLPEDITQASQAQLAAGQNAYTQQNAKYLKNYGLDVNANTLSAAHFLGAKGLKDYLDNGYISPAAAKANGGEDKVRQIVQARLGGQYAPASGGVQTAPAPQAAPQAQAQPGAVNPADMGEFAGLDQAIATQAAQPHPQFTPEQLNTAMDAEVQRQKDYEALNGNDWKRTLALLESPDKTIAGQAAANMEEMFKNKRMREYAQTTVDSSLAKGEVPDIKRLKGEEGSYIKAYLFARLGLTDLAQQEQEKISPTKTHMPVMIGDKHYAATYSKNGELLGARDEEGRPVDAATFNKIASNAFAAKGATTGQSFMKDESGNIWSHTVTPGTNQVIWTNQTTGKAQTTAPTGLTPFGQVNPATRTNISLAASAVRRMEAQNLKDKAAGLTPTYSQEQIAAEQEKITNGGQPSAGVQKLIESAPAETPAEGKRPVGEIERRGTPALEAQARAIYEGDQEMPKGMGATNARNQWLSARVNEMAQQEGKPYDPTLFKNRQEIETAFTKGPEAKVVRSLNVAIGHLDTLNDAAKALKNGQIPLFNDIGNKFAKNTGQPAPTDFNALKSIVGSEVAKAVTGGASALGDREEIRAEINSANSPAQLAGVINKYQDLMAEQMKGAKRQYESAGGNRWNSKIEPRTQEVMDKIEKEKRGSNTIPAPYTDADKERRYQEWLKKRNAGK
jgi:hypothetical protein